MWNSRAALVVVLANEIVDKRRTCIHTYIHHSFWLITHLLNQHKNNNNGICPRYYGRNKVEKIFIHYADACVLFKTNHHKYNQLYIIFSLSLWIVACCGFGLSNLWFQQNKDMPTMISLRTYVRLSLFCSHNVIVCFFSIKSTNFTLAFVWKYRLIFVICATSWIRHWFDDC